MMALMEKLRRFMYGRYGGDKLNVALIIIAMLLSLVAGALGSVIVQIVAYLVVIWALFRMFSKNTQARYKENTAFLKLWNPVEKWGRLQYNKLRDIKTHRYFHCPNCKNTLRVPKGKGEITITCPVCKHKFDRKT